MQFVYLAALAVLAEAAKPAPSSPYGYGDWKPPLCKIVTRAATFWNEEAVATSFCSSYLAIPLRTAVTTATQLSTTTTTPPLSTTTSSASPVTVTVPSSSTSTVSVTSTVKDPINTITSTTPIPVTSTITACVSPPPSTTIATVTVAGPNRKRNFRRPVAKPVCFQDFGADAALSSACRCFDISPSTTTTLTTSTSIITSAGMASTMTVTTTPTITVSVLNTITTTFTTTTTDTVTVGSTTTVATIYGRPTTQVQILARGYVDYNNQIMYRNYTLNYDNSIQDVVGVGFESQGAASTFNLWTIDETTGYLTTVGNDGTTIYRASSRLTAAQINDPNQTILRVSANSPSAQSNPALQCTLTTDPITGICPVMCQVAEFDMNAADSSGFSVYYSLQRDATNTPTYNLFAIPPQQ